jgi:Ni/Co efflux regulator RcnB
MKKLLASIIAVSMIATPALAQRNDRQYGSYERYERYERNHHKRHNRGVRTGEAVALILGGAILGAAISKNNRRERETVVYQDYRTQVCQDIIKYDYYGNPYVTGRNCWYQ